MIRSLYSYRVEMRPAYPSVGLVLAEQQEERDHYFVNSRRGHDVLADSAHCLVVEAEMRRNVQFVRPLLRSRPRLHQLWRQRVLRVRVT